MKKYTTLIKKGSSFLSRSRVVSVCLSYGAMVQSLKLGQARRFQHANKFHPSLLLNKMFRENCNVPNDVPYQPCSVITS